MRFLTKIIIGILILSASISTQAQIFNLNNFDKNLLHYGISIGYLQSKFTVQYTENESVQENIMGVTSYYIPGFHISIIGDLRLNEYMNLRLIPGISFVDRTLKYSLSESYISNNYNPDRERRVESVYGDLPLELKIRAQRWRNFRPYVIGGIRYGFDFASLKNNKNKDDQSIIRLSPSDFSYTMGVGFDFYFPYFKFAIELKMGFGLVNLKIPDETYYTRSIEKINSRSFTLSITVEG